MKSLKVIFALTLLFKKLLYICFVSQKGVFFCFIILKKIKLKEKNKGKERFVTHHPVDFFRISY